jgi:hypothetical protein
MGMRLRFGSLFRGGPAPEETEEQTQEEAPEPEQPPEPLAPTPTAAPDVPPPLSLTLGEATSALRAAGADTIRVGFLARAYARAGEADRAKARSLLVSVLEERLRARDLLRPGQGFELLDT